MSKKKVWVSIDPGAAGAVAVIDKDNNVLELRDYSEHLADDITLIKEKYDITMCLVEKVSAMRGQGVSSMFTFGYKVGEIHGILHTLGIPFVEVRPQQWQANLGLPKDKKQRKKAIGSIAQSMFPDASLFGSRGGYKDGRGDALLMAQYCKQNY